MKKSLRLALIIAMLVTNVCFAAEREELLEIKNTIINLLDALVEQGVITAEKAATLKREAQQKAKADVKVETATMATAPAQNPPAPADRVENASQSEQQKVVRVPYVPEFVKEEIREQVRAELHADVKKDLIATAKEQRWGIKDALPEWITRMRWSGDIRARVQSDLFSEDNIANAYPDFDEINEAGGVSRAGQDAFFNFTEDRNRLRLRLRLGFETDITDVLTVGARMATGNLSNPISLNQTLGSADETYQLNLERAYLRWQASDWLLLHAGRSPNPFVRETELIFDNDINLEGVSAQLHYDIPYVRQLSLPNGSKTGHGRRLFLNAGIFPLDEGEIAFADGSSNDKWLWGTQFGGEFAFTSLHSAMLAVAFFDYINVQGQRNTLGSTLKDWTAPDSVTKGNTMFDIRNDADPTTNLFALASDFQLANLTAAYRYAGFHPLRLTASVDIVKNIGFDRRSILRRTGADISERSLGYVTQFRFGYPEIKKFGQWSAFFGYRYMQRDAVIDAFTDSNFHLSGTDAQGYYVGGLYGLTRDTWVRVRWLSSDEIDGAPLGIDTLQVDLNAQF